ncbi:hypothetical protein LJK88_47580 [Paenibacillus sp. P26]|nr:hypothetical protein LJK88_47580 [Paenibacillus sp. P26]UUZ91778.1 hypothetical protein LJK87_40750 [Paenibacillus sp. P25]
MARFRIIQTSKEEDAFIIYGHLLEGQIHEGMQIHVPLNNSLDVTGVINEVIKNPHHHEIAIECSNADEADFWDILNLIGEVIVIK